ncbi:RagB/SusD family nutrient uptake outer membrane protein [Carboxylicivirga linearis]|uniref:RagB/SusD family nutrient uptake outer membrane protein n=1 Tax=Carboxylicivirga linearis TaxID=1628157 RepID=A0ABS5JRU0_9BACT|nr:RagB/SusD family nutrient uptake outer membrane protein [Carboxylicivirga linearis]MBS2097284.1 RagB/SusD family nutrient uptake outer membrane protein [Carboxylicivirga linearis]
MKRKYLYTLLAPVLMFFYGCEDSLNTAPEGDEITQGTKEEVYANDPAKAKASVNSIFAQFTQYAPNYTALGDVTRHNDFGYPSVMMFTDANGEDMVMEVIGYNWANSSLDFSDREFDSNEAQIVWNDMYSIIYNCNSVIGSIDEETEETPSQFYLAQGLAVRAFSYWNLAQLYQFNYKGNEAKPCVPIVTHLNANEVALAGAPRATVQEVYNLMLADINSAIALLSDAEEAEEPVVRDDKRYVSLAVAYGLRARINLTMHNYAEAAADAQSAIDASDATPGTMEDVGKPSFMSVNESNWMWGIIINETDGVVTSGIVNWISHLGSLNWGYCNYNGGRQISKKLFNTIPDTDIRKGWFLDENGESANLNAAQAAQMVEVGYRPYTHVKFAPYNNEVATTTNSNDVPLMRIEEMYLIKAEALAMSGGDGKGALETFVKSYRDPSYVCNASSPEGIQEEVYHQRRVELWGEGMNWFDIMRLNKGVDRRGAGFINASVIFNIPSNSDILLWRISEPEIEANPLIGHGDNNPAAPAPEPVADID